MANENKLIKYSTLQYFKAKLDTLLNEKVDKVSGKGLSANDYTDAEKTKLGGVEAGAQVNIIEKIKFTNVPDTQGYKGTETFDVDPSTKTATIDLDSLRILTQDAASFEYARKMETQLELAKKVDKVEGMGLSHNDLTDDLVTKINNAAGGNITLDYNNLTNKPVNATTSKDGFMSKEDKAKLDGMGNTIDSKIEDALAQVSSIVVLGTANLPSKGETKTLYVRTNSDGERETYIYDSSWVLIAESGLKSAVTSLTNQISSNKEALETEINKKVAKVDGMGLSHNDLTDDLVLKINNASSGNITIPYENVTGTPTTATTTKEGLLSASDKVKIDNMVSTIDSAIKAEIGKINHFKTVDTLPATGEVNTFYLVPNSGSGNNTKDEYIYINNKWELIGTTEVDLTDYAKKETLNNYVLTTTLTSYVKTTDLEYASTADIDAMFD